MAEKTQGIQNKWLLLIAAALGVVVVLIYNVHIRAIRAQQASQMIEVVKVTRDLARGERVTGRDIAPQELPRTNMDAFGQIVLWKDRDTILAGGGKPLQQPVKKDELLMWNDVLGTRDVKGASRLGDNMVGISIEFEQSLGDMLTVGDTVNLLGKFSVDGQPFRFYRIIEGLRVMNIGGRGALETAGRIGRNVGGRAREITVEIPRAISPQLQNLLTHSDGMLRLEVNRSGDRLPANAGEINPELQELAETARPTGSVTTFEPEAPVVSD